MLYSTWDCVMTIDYSDVTLPYLYYKIGLSRCHTVATPLVDHGGHKMAEWWGEGWRRRLPDVQIVDHSGIHRCPQWRVQAITLRCSMLACIIIVYFEHFIIADCSVLKESWLQHIVQKTPPPPPIDSIWALVLLWRTRRKIIRTALCCAVLCCVQQLSTMLCTHVWAIFTFLHVRFRFFLCVYLGFVFFVFFHVCLGHFVLV